MWIFLNDKFVPAEEATISVFDHGFLYGDGVYETLRTYAGAFFLITQHLARLARSGTLIGLPMPYSDEAWIGILQQLLSKNGLAKEPGRPETPQDAYIRITVSRGPGEIGLDPSLCPTPTVFILAKPLPHYPATVFEQGVALSIVSVRRNVDAAIPPRIKSLNFLNNILAKQEALRHKAFDGVMLNVEGSVAECTTSNLFFVQEGRLCTPSLECGILDGITRNVVLQLARDHDIPVVEGQFTPEHLLEADECFITNTSMEIMPVARINQSPIGADIPGPLTQRLRRLFRHNLPTFLS